MPVDDGHQELGVWSPVLCFREKGAQVTDSARFRDQQYRWYLDYPDLGERASGEAKAAVIPFGRPENAHALGSAPEARRANRMVGASASAACILAVRTTAEQPVSRDGRLVIPRRADDPHHYSAAISSALAAAPA